MEGHVRPPTGQTDQTEYPQRHAREVEYLTGPGNEPRTRRARARSTGGARRALTIAAGALAAALAGGGIVFAVMNHIGVSDTPVSGPARGGAPAGDTGAAEEAPPANGKSPADEAESAGGSDDDSGGAEHAYGADDAWSGSDAGDRNGNASAGRTDSRGSGTSDRDDKGKNGGADKKDSDKKQNSGEEETYKNWPFDGPVGYVHPQGPS